ncbi:hypothetical protein NC652_035103 [Populus alba x Populus x berolinensis]|nr:hypothetical protein NC652_035103 [Populus alba x Populus x berolinensis]
MMEARQDYVINKRNPTKSPKKVQLTEQVHIIEQNGNHKSEVTETKLQSKLQTMLRLIIIITSSSESHSLSMLEIL